MRSLILLRNQEVKNIDTVDKIQGEIAIYQLRQASQGKELGKYDNKVMSYYNHSLKHRTI